MSAEPNPSRGERLVATRLGGVGERSEPGVGTGEGGVALLVGVGLVSFAAVSLSVLLTRIYSASLGHHFAFLAVSLALFGAGVGAGIVTLAPSLVAPGPRLRNLALASSLSAILATLATIESLVTKAPAALDGKGIRAIATLYVLSSLPFVGAGVVLSGALQGAGRRASRIYVADMMGAALGGLAALGLLRLGAPRGALVTSITFAVAGAVLAAGTLRAKVKGGGWPASAILASSLALFLGDYGEQWLTVKQLRAVNLERAQVIAWNELALVTVDRPLGGTAQLRIDGNTATSILAAKTAVPKHPADIGYALSFDRGPTLVLGAGGGREVKAALAAGQTEIVAVEINRAIVHDVMLGKMKDFTGGLYERPEVEVVVADGRSYLRSTDRRFQNIVASLVDTGAAASVGGMALAESSLYTVEAVRDMLVHLTPDGLLVVTRWDAERERLVALAAGALLADGVKDPSRHLLACSYSDATALVVSRAELDEEAVSTLRHHCSARSFEVVLAPDLGEEDALARIARDPYREAAARADRDISPPTDDRPFFFYDVPPRRVLAVLADGKRLAREEHGLLAALLVTMVSAVASLVFFVAPLFARPQDLLRASARGKRARLLAFFAASGLGFSVAEMGLVQTLTTLLGHPVYALSVVLFALLVGVALGSHLVRDVPLERAMIVARGRARILTVAFAVLSLVLVPVTSHLVGAPMAARASLSVLVALGLGVGMGALTPLGIAIGTSRSETLVPWSLSLSGFFGVVGTGLATFVAMNAGYSWVMTVAAVAYAVAAIAVPGAAPVGEPPPPAKG